MIVVDRINARGHFSTLCHEAIRGGGRIVIVTREGRRFPCRSADDATVRAPFIAATEGPLEIEVHCT